MPLPVLKCSSVNVNMNVNINVHGERVDRKTISLGTLDAFLDSLEEGVLFLNQDRRVVAVNEAALQMIGSRDAGVVEQLCPSIFAGTQCARECETRGRCALAPEKNTNRIMQDIELRRSDHSSVFLRMWGLFLPKGSQQLYCAIILRNRSHEVELEKEVRERLRLGGMVGHSQAMQTLYEQILRAAASDATVLVTGESGTGKELVARALHDNSTRSAGPYVALHCAALPENLLESELFGYAKGAFTGAAAARAGRFEAAQGGTLLLDELGEISPGIQVKLLRVLQEREVVRLGENNARPVDVRIIAATHRDLAAMVARGEFREDLYYRLRVLPLHVLPLRERGEDIPLIANKILNDLKQRYKRERLQLAHDTLLLLENYAWPGNIRQLSNALEYAVVHADGGAILPQHLPPEVGTASGTERQYAANVQREVIPLRPYYHPPHQPEEELTIILRTLTETGGNKAEAARKLGMSRTTLWKKLRQKGPVEEDK